MLRLIILACFIYYISAIDQQTWINFKLKHKKNYSSEEHEANARANFEYWDQKIQDHNIRYYAAKVSYKMDHNKFSDLTPEEFKNLQKLKTRNVDSRPATPAFDDPDFKIPHGWKPTSIDLRTCKFPIRDQEKCGSCWAFSAVAVIEWYLHKKHNMTVDLSEQNIVDCAVNYGGCEGGTQEDAFAYFIKNGLDFEDVYKYNATDNRCQYEIIYDDETGVSKKYAPKNYYSIGRNETKWAWAIEEFGFITVSVSTGGWQHYKKGIFSASDCGGSVDHAVAIVGYDTDPVTKTDYWIVRNSWGEDWGDHGYMFLERNKKACKIIDAIYVH